MIIIIFIGIIININIINNIEIINIHIFNIIFIIIQINDTINYYKNIIKYY